MRLSGKTAIVTGGAGGIGRGITRAFVAEGARVLVVDINDEAGEALAPMREPVFEEPPHQTAPAADVTALARGL